MDRYKEFFNRQDEHLGFMPTNNNNIIVIRVLKNRPQNNPFRKHYATKIEIIMIRSPTGSFRYYKGTNKSGTTFYSPLQYYRPVIYEGKFEYFLATRNIKSRSNTDLILSMIFGVNHKHAEFI